MTDSAYLKKKEKKMKVLERLDLMAEVATKLGEMKNIKKVDAILDEYSAKKMTYTTGSTLKDYALDRLEGIAEVSLINIAGYELDMDLSKFKSIPSDSAF